MSALLRPCIRLARWSLHESVPLRIVCILITVAALSGRARARQINYVSQTRIVGAYASLNAKTSTAADFGPFVADVSCDYYSGYQYYYARATQSSTLDACGIAMSGTTKGQCVNGDASGHSSLYITFDVVNDQPFIVTGFGSNGSTSMTSRIRLFSDVQTLVDWQPPSEQYGSVDVSGVLTPGRYTFNASFSAVGLYSSTYAVTNAFAARLLVPEPNLPSAACWVAALASCFRRVRRSMPALRPRPRVRLPVRSWPALRELAKWG